MAMLTVKCTEEELASWHRKAERHEMKLSELVRRMLNGEVPKYGVAETKLEKNPSVSAVRIGQLVEVPPEEEWCGRCRRQKAWNVKCPNCGGKKIDGKKREG